MPCPLTGIIFRELHPKAESDDHYMVICQTCGWEHPAISRPIAIAIGERHNKLSEVLR